MEPVTSRPIRITFSLEEETFLIETSISGVVSTTLD
jgi:hypothetical protein